MTTPTPTPTPTTTQDRLFDSDQRVATAIRRCARVLRRELPPEGNAVQAAIRKLREAQAAALMGDLERMWSTPLEDIPDSEIPY